MLTDKKGEAAAQDIANWGNGIAAAVDKDVRIDVHDDYPDSNTYVLRLVKGARVLVFRLSASQVHTDGKETECERTLKRKIKDLENLI